MVWRLPNPATSTSHNGHHSDSLFSMGAEPIAAARLDKVGLRVAPPIRLVLGGLALASRLEVGRLSFQEAAMTVSDVGREGVRLVSQLTGVAISVPVVAGFVLLGAAVLVGRSLLDVGRKLLETKPRARGPLKAA